MLRRRGSRGTFWFLRYFGLCPDNFYLLWLYFALFVERFRLNDLSFVEARIVAGRAPVSMQHVLTDRSSDGLRAHLNVVHLVYVELYDLVQRFVEPVVLEQLVQVKGVRGSGILRVFVRHVVLLKLDPDERYFLALCELHDLLCRAVTQPLHLFHDCEAVLIEESVY